MDRERKGCLLGCDSSRIRIVDGASPAISPCGTFFARRLSVPSLRLKSVQDRGEEPGETAVDFEAAGGVMHLNAAPFPPDQAGLSQSLKMMREGRLGNVLFADLQKVGAIAGKIRTGNIGIDSHADRIGEGVKNTFYGNVFDRWMKKRPHERFYYRAVDS